MYNTLLPNYSRTLRFLLRLAPGKPDHLEDAWDKARGNPTPCNPFLSKCLLQHFLLILHPHHKPSQDSKHKNQTTDYAPTVDRHAHAVRKPATECAVPSQEQGEIDYQDDNLSRVSRMLDIPINSIRHQSIRWSKLKGEVLSELSKSR